MPLGDWIDDILSDPGTSPFHDPGSTWTQPTTNMSSTGSFNSYAPTTDWGGLVTSWLKLAPNVISAVKGSPYASGPYGQSSYPQAGGAPGQSGVYAGGSFLGASGFGQLSGTTLILIGLVAFMVLRRK